MSEAPHILIVEAPYYTDIVEEMVQGAIRVLEAQGASWERLSVPGAFEIPVAIRYAVESMERFATGARYAGYLALGCVIRGETTHYDYVCGESARGLMDLALQHNLAIGYGILTCENGAQARARSAHDQKDKGGEAARACLRMIELQRHFGIDQQ